jgi:hypothetical protein
MDKTICYQQMSLLEDDTPIVTLFITRLRHHHDFDKFL